MRWTSWARYLVLAAGLGLFLLPAGPAAGSWGGHYGHYGYGHHGYGHHGRSHHGHGRHRHGHHGHGHRGHGYYGYGYLGYGLLDYATRPRYYSGYPRAYAPRRYSAYDPYAPRSGTVTYIGDSSPAVTSVVSTGETGDGWTLLAEGRTTAALQAFGRAAEGHPKEGRPKVGYALAAAASGDLDRGVWAMRRAFRIDPHATHYIDLSEPLRGTASGLIGRYRGELGGSRSGDADAWFMTAALRYLIHDRDEAREALDHAVEQGDNSPSTANLRSLIETDAPKDRP